MTITFDEMFQPLLNTGNISGQRIELRPQQRHLGWAVVESINERTNLVGEARTGTGKSVAYLLPAIHAAREDKRTVVSTETTALQDQLTKKDLPALAKIYDGFTFCSLKGRSWYYCANRARMMTRGNAKLSGWVSRLEAHLTGGLGIGERPDLERFLGVEIESDAWKELSGQTEFCADNKCTGDRCFSARARAKAADSDIVVTNHAMLRTDADMNAGSDGEINILGEVDVLVVDEAHTLEAVLVDGWTQSLMPWDISTARASVLEGLQTAGPFVAGSTYELEDEVSRSFDQLDLALKNITSFFKMRAELAADGRRVDWKRQNFPLSEVSFRGKPEQKIYDAMVEYETETPARFLFLEALLRKVEKVLKDAADEAEDQGRTGRRKIRKGTRASRQLADTLGLITKALPTKDGIILDYGVPYGVIVEGVGRFGNPDTIGIKVVPLDISSRCAATVFDDRTTILLSATLTDPVDGTFTYTAASLGISGYKTVMVDSPFTYATQQLVYVTPADRVTADVAGAKYSLEELVDLLHAVDGRTLVLFTARAELDHAAEQLKAMGLPWPIHVQDKTSNKQKLVEAFKSDEKSVLIATKSFFTGVDFPGATCSTVAICKFPLPQYNTLCKQQITWWRGRGFRNWYEREALLVFAQAAGRLIRSSSDHGVVALLDQRAASPSENVSKTAATGIRGLGSRVTSSLDEVQEFLAQGLQTADTAV